MGGRSVIARDILSRRKFKVGIPGKRLSISHGKVVLKPKRRGRLDISDASTIHGVTAALGKKELVLELKLSELGEFAVAYDPVLAQAVIKTMIEIHNEIYKYVSRNKIKMVPEETGKLRRSILRSLSINKHRIENDGMLIMELGTSVPYFPYVNEMETFPSGNMGPHLRHPPHLPTYKKGKRSKRPLYDPWALKNFFNWLVFNTRTEAAKITRRRIIANIFDPFKSRQGWTAWRQAMALFRRRSS